VKYAALSNNVTPCAHRFEIEDPVLAAVLFESRTLRHCFANRRDCAVGQVAQVDRFAQAGKKEAAAELTTQATENLRVRCDTSLSYKKNISAMQRRGAVT
jgi:hypothetical protein